jgi:tetratricopeptide (TPR) repeat protein
VQSTVPVPPEPAAPAPSTAAAAAPIASVAPTPVPEPARAPAEMPAAQPSPAATEAKSRGGGAAAEGCDADLVHTTPWLLSPDACARAFEADPNNASLALGIAHAEHVRGHFAESAQWASRALALEPKAAEAYILIARAAAQSERPEEAQAAYRRYLELAPRGWHQAEARTGRRGR